MRVFTPFASDDAVVEIGRGFCDRTLPKSAWTHAAHFATTLWILKDREDLDASRDLPSLIRAYNAHVGGVNSDTAGYHETITQASIRASRAFLAAHPQCALAECCNALMASALGDPDWLLEYWSRERLFSTEARGTWVEPDLAPLPF